MKKIVILTLIAAAIAGNGVYGAAHMAVPADVSPTHWIYGAVQGAAEDGWLVTEPSGAFRPEAAASRREVALLLTGAWRIAEENGRTAVPLPKAPAGDGNFSDMASTDANSQKALKQLVAAGVLSGYPEGLIKPEESITRLEMAVILTRISKAAGTPSQGFKDGDQIPQWGQAAAEKAAALGLISGYTDGTFRPVQAVTRAEAVQMIGRWADPSVAPLMVSRGQSPVAADPMTADILRLVNEERAGKGLAPLRTNQTLAKAAVFKASAMASGNYFAHTSPQGEDVEALLVRFGVKDWSRLGENLLRMKGSVTAETAVAAWMKSESHRAILLSPYTDTGLGFARAADGTVYIAQAFAAF